MGCAAVGNQSTFGLMGLAVVQCTYRPRLYKGLLFRDAGQLDPRHASSSMPIRRNAHRSTAEATGLLTAISFLSCPPRRRSSRHARFRKPQFLTWNNCESACGISSALYEMFALRAGGAPIPGAPYQRSLRA